MSSFLAEHFKLMGVYPRLIIVTKYYRSATLLGNKLKLEGNERHWAYNLKTIRGIRNYIYTIYLDAPDGLADMLEVIKIQDGKYFNPDELETIVRFDKGDR